MNLLEQIDNLANTSNKDDWDQMVTGKAILNAEQETQFLRELQIVDPIMTLSTIKLMSKPSRQASRFSIKRGALQWGYSSGHNTKTDLTPAEKEFNGQEITTTKMKALTSFTDDEMEENIEQSSFQQTLLSEVAYILGLDNAEWHVFGDTQISAEKDPNVCLKAGDGWIKRTNENNILESADVASGTPDFKIDDGVEVMFDALFEALPVAARQKIQTEGVYLCPYEIEDAYRNSQIGRNTPLGDSKLEGYDGLKYKGRPVIYCPTFDSEIGQGIDETATCMLTTPDNIEQNMFKQMSVELDRVVDDERTDAYFRFKGMPSLVHDRYISCAKISLDEKKDIQENSRVKTIAIERAGSGN